MKEQILKLANNKGLGNIRISETEDKYLIQFNPIPLMCKIDKIGFAFRQKFSANEIGWASDWIIIKKNK
tara:strand:+ start:465 stop:671 length:207 start_codon:yes stop_codon:yes gene_type:complete